MKSRDRALRETLIGDSHAKEAVPDALAKPLMHDVPIAKPHKGKGIPGRKRGPGKKRGERIVPGIKAEPWKAAVTHIAKERRADGLPMFNNTVIKEETDPTLTMSYYDTITFSRKVISEQWATRIAKELVEWVESNPNAIKINEFLRLKGIFYRDFYYFVGRYDILAKALDYAKRALGDYRERNILERKWEPSAGQYMMNHYDEDWRAETERRDKVKQNLNQTPVTDLTEILKIVLNPQAPTQEVMDRKESFNATTSTPELSSIEPDLSSESQT